MLALQRAQASWRRLEQFTSLRTPVPLKPESYQNKAYFLTCLSSLGFWAKSKERTTKKVRKEGKKVSVVFILLASPLQLCGLTLVGVGAGAVLWVRQETPKGLAEEAVTDEPLEDEVLQAFETHHRKEPRHPPLPKAPKQSNSKPPETPQKIEYPQNR
eukprot:4690913-Amphidinium_carterae.1